MGKNGESKKVDFEGFIQKLNNNEALIEWVAVIFGIVVTTVTTYFFCRALSAQFAELTEFKEKFFLFLFVCEPGLLLGGFPATFYTFKFLRDALATGLALIWLPFIGIPIIVITLEIMVILTVFTLPALLIKRIYRIFKPKKKKE